MASEEMAGIIALQVDLKRPLAPTNRPTKGTKGESTASSSTYIDASGVNCTRRLWSRHTVGTFCRTYSSRAPAGLSVWEAVTSATLSQ
eukprot:7206114-Pyramimonas_sp.AAC.1